MRPHLALWTLPLWASHAFVGPSLGPSARRHLPVLSLTQLPLTEEEGRLLPQASSHPRPRPFVFGTLTTRVSAPLALAAKPLVLPLGYRLGLLEASDLTAATDLLLTCFPPPAPELELMGKSSLSGVGKGSTECTVEESLVGHHS